jgi:hypothetical protein
VAEAEALYHPLFALRDEYFATPRAGSIGAYLQEVAALEKTVEFERLVDADKLARLNFEQTTINSLEAADASLQHHASVLEVFELLEESSVRR